MPARPVALVTGASRGIGAAIARGLAERGCRIVVHCRAQAAAAREVLSSLPGEGHLIVTADVATEEGVDTLWKETLRATGQVDILVNNAGIYDEHPPLTSDPAAWRAAWRATLAANLFGPAHLSHLAARAMAAHCAASLALVEGGLAVLGEASVTAVQATLRDAPSKARSARGRRTVMA